MKLFNFILLFLLSFTSNAQLIINEVCAVNSSVYVDNYSENSDWIELKNSGTSAIQLNQYFLQSSDLEKSPWQLPNQALAPNQLVIIFASELNEFKNNTAHTNFKLDRYLDTVKLLSSSQATIDEIGWDELPQNISIGKNTSTQTIRYYSDPTPDAENNSTEFLGICTAPKFSKTSSFFQGTLTLELTSAHPVYFTYDLDTPTTASEVFQTPIQSDTTFTLAARSIQPNYIPSPISYHTFVKGSAPNFPVVFLHTSPDNLYSEDHGIFVKGANADPNFPYYGANYWADIQFPGYLHLLSPGQRTLFSGNLGMEPHGGSSARNKEQKPLRLIFKEEYGENRLKAKLFSSKSADKFKRLVLRNSGGDFNKTLFRDGILHLLMIEDQLHLELSGYSPTRAYINGENWGIYNFREKVGPHYIESNYDIDRDSIHLIEEDYHIIQGDSIEHFNLVQYAIDNDLSQSIHYNWINDHIDLKNFIDYFSAEIILANADWPNNNLKLWKPLSGGKWRYILFDLDASLGLFSWLGPDYNMWERLHLPKVLVNHHVILYNQLMENDEFRRHFINRYADLANTTFSFDKYVEEVDKVKSHLLPQMSFHNSKWGGSEQAWEAEIEKSLDWVEDREVHHRQQIQDSLFIGDQYNLKLNVYPSNAGNIQLNTLNLSEFPWEGIYFNQNSIDLSVAENSTFTFSHWLMHKDESQNTSKTINIDFDDDTEITAVFTATHHIENKLQIFPSPVSFGEAFTLSFIQPEKDNPTIEIFTLNGQLVFSKIMEESLLGEKNISIQTNQLAQGAYVVRVTGQNFSITNKLFMK